MAVLRGTWFGWAVQAANKQAAANPKRDGLIIQNMRKDRGCGGLVGSLVHWLICSSVAQQFSACRFHRFKNAVGMEFW